jgi:hypothetical protein
MKHYRRRQPHTVPALNAERTGAAETVTPGGQAIAASSGARPLLGSIRLPTPPPLPKLPDAGWRCWVAENLLRGCTPESMLATMTGQGLDAGACAELLRTMPQEPTFIAAKKWQQIQRKQESVMANLQRVWELSPTYAQVERRAVPTRTEFFERYVEGCRPVVFTGVADDWPARTRWSPQDLRARFGQFEIEIQAERNADPKFEQNKLAHKRRMRLDAFVDQVLAGGATNDYYLTANNELLRTPEFAPLLADIGSLPDFCNGADLARCASFWFGPAGTTTPLHHDTIMLLHTQIVGRKRWRFISPLETPKLYNYVDVYSPIDLDAPDLVRYPAFKDVKVLEAVVGPGDTVFLPLGWWHQVTALDVSLSFSYTNILVPNTYAYTNPTLHDW